MIKLFDHTFSLFMLPLHAPDARWAKQYKVGHALWDDVWLNIQRRFEVPGPLFLDGFTRQDEGAFIYTGNVCAGLLLFRIMDFSILDYRKDSYFKEWTELDMERVLRNGRRIFTASYLTVHPDFRNFHPDLKFKQVLMNIMIRRFLKSEADVILNTSRRDRNVHEEGFKLGGRLVRENVEYFGGRERVDFVLFTRQSARETKDEPLLSGFVDDLWRTRADWKPDTAAATSGKAA